MASNLEFVINNTTVKNDHIIAKLDSGASKHFFLKKITHVFLKNIKILQNEPIAHLPNGTSAKAAHEGTINLGPYISTKSSKFLVFPNLTNES